MTLVLPLAAYNATIPSSHIGEDSTTSFSSWNKHHLGDNKETTTTITGAGNNRLVVGGSITTGPCSGTASSPSAATTTPTNFLQQLAIPKAGYTNLTPDNSSCALPPPAAGGYPTNTNRPGTPCALLRQQQTPQVPSHPCSSPVSCSSSSNNNNNVNSHCGSIMCGTTGPCLSQCKSRRDSCSPASPMKRKLTLIDYEEDCDPRPKRISPFHNTPKQRRDEKRKVLRMSIQKLRQIDDPELFLRRSVLINNMTKRMQKELREEKRYGYGYGYYPSTFSSYVDCPVEQDCFYSSPPAHRKRLNSSCTYTDMDCESGSTCYSSSSSSSSHLPSSPSSLASSDNSSSSINNHHHHSHHQSELISSTSHHHQHHHLPNNNNIDNNNHHKSVFVDEVDDDTCLDCEPVEKLADDDLSDTLMRTVCGSRDEVEHDDVVDDDDDNGNDSHRGGHRHHHNHQQQQQQQYHEELIDPSLSDQDMESCVSLSDSSSEESSPPASPPSDSEMTESSGSNGGCNSRDKGSTLTEMDKQILGEMDNIFNNLISVLSET